MRVLKTTLHLLYRSPLVQYLKSVVWMKSTAPEVILVQVSPAWTKSVLVLQVIIFFKNERNGQSFGAIYVRH